MTTVAITPRAAAHLRSEIAADENRRSVLALVWEGPQADLRRGPAGEAIWTRQAPGRWSVARFPPNEIGNLKVREIDGFPIVVDWPEKATADSRLTIDYVNGELVVI
jgi:hypothetical protein